MVDLLRWTDCLGRAVVLDEETWLRKILLDHDELDGNEAAVEHALADPDVRTQDKVHADREVFYRTGLLPPPYHDDLLKVVVAYRRGDGGTRQGRIVTAYAVDRVARGEKRLWTSPRFDKP